MNIIVGVTGGIAAYKVGDMISGLKHCGHDVRVIMTDNATEFITPLTVATLSGHPVMQSMWDNREGNVDHIDVAKWAEAFIVYPATANIVGKFANGIADDLLSTVYLALPKDVMRIVFLAMNTVMLESNPVQRNISVIEQDGCKVPETRTTRLACGDVGKGAALKPRDAVIYVQEKIALHRSES